MRAGRLSTRFVWQRLAVTDGDDGQVRTWATLGGVWGDVREASTRTLLESDQLMSNGTVIVETRGEATIRPSDRLIAGEYYFEVNGVSPDRMKRGMNRVECTRRFVPAVEVVRSRVECAGYLVTVGASSNG